MLPRKELRRPKWRLHSHVLRMNGRVLLSPRSTYETLILRQQLAVLTRRHPLPRFAASYRFDFYSILRGPCVIDPRDDPWSPIIPSESSVSSKANSGLSISIPLRADQIVTRESLREKCVCLFLPHNCLSRRIEVLFRMTELRF